MSPGTVAIPKPVSKDGCAFCDQLTQGRQYRGKIREYRTTDGRTIPWTDTASGLQLTRTMDFTANTGAVMRGGEITHNDRVHQAVANVTNLIAFTVASTGMKRYALIQDNSISAILAKVRAKPQMSVDEIADDIVDLDDLGRIDALLAELQTNIPPQRVERVVSRIVRNPRIAQLIKERQSHICEICGRKPFFKQSGEPYAEADHIRPLGGDSQGLDTPENLRCLCAQCHAVITYGSDEAIR